MTGTGALIGLGLFGPISRSSATGRAFDLLIRGAHVLDGSGEPGLTADLGVIGDRIAAVGKLTEAKAYRVIAADGLAVAPGFIDIHSHSEDELLVNPRAESKIRQGVTTEILGQDGASIAPLTPEMQAALGDSYQRTYGISVEWLDFEGYFKKLQKQGVAVNVGTMLGQGTLREFVAGRADRPATLSEINQMKSLVAQALKDGALGVSSGLEYPPGAFASSEELIEICKVMHFSTGLYATHMRNEADFVLEALDEAIAVAKGADVALHISHLKCMGKRNWSKLETVFENIQQARARGLSITMDRYPYTAYNTSLSSLFPIWARSGSQKDFLARLQDPAVLPRIRQETLDKVKMIGSWQAVMITSVELDKNKHLEGRRVPQVVGNNGADEFEFVRHLILAENNSIDMCGFAMSEENTARILTHPLCIVASDASARATYGPLSQSTPHPRTYGTFPRVLGKYVREQRTLALPEAIRKMSALPARRLGLRNRGLIRKDYFADLVLFDPEKVADKATFTAPHQYPQGIDYVFVNGVAVIDQGEHTGILPGRILKRIPTLLPTRY